MAVFTGKNNTYTGELTVTTSSYNIEENYTPVTVTLKLKSSSSSFGSYTIKYSYTIDGTTYSGSWRGSLGINDSKTLVSNKIVNVNHNVDGTKSLPVSAKIWSTDSASYLPGTINMSGSMQLATIPRASSFGTISGSTIGSVMSIDINRHSDTFTHNLTYTFGNVSGTIETDATTSASFTLPLDLAYQIPNSTNGTLYITMQTYSGSTPIGTAVSKSVTISVPSSMTPSLSGISVSERNSKVSSVSPGIFVQGLSSINLAMTDVTTSYGSQIASYIITFNGATVNSSTMVSALTYTGTKTATATIKDTRGRTASASVDITVVAYSGPKITSASAIRSESSGIVKAATTFTQVADKNAMTITISRAARDGSEAATETIVSNTTTSPYNVDKTYSASTDKGYNYTIKVTDKYGEFAEYIVNISTASKDYDFNKNGFGVGKMRERGSIDAVNNIYSEKAIIGSYLGSYPKGDGSSEGKVIVLPYIPYSAIDPTRDTTKYLQELLKWICKNYPSTYGGVFIGDINPNSRGPAIIQIYDTNAVSNGLPEYSTGMFTNLGGYLEIFGTNDYSFYHHGAASWTDITNKPSTFPPSSHNHEYITDRTTGNATYLNYGAAGVTSTSWLAAWNEYELRTIAPSVALEVMGGSPIGTSGYDTLWSGSSYTPSFTINNFKNYKFFLVASGSSSSIYGTLIIVPYRPGLGQFRGIGGFETPSKGVEIYSIDGTTSENENDMTVTIREGYFRSSYNSWSGSAGTKIYIKAIYGIK